MGATNGFRNVFNGWDKRARSQDRGIVDAQADMKDRNQRRLHELRLEYEQIEKNTSCCVKKMRKGEAATVSYIQVNLHVCASQITVVDRERR